jgi:hypothetical protein
MQIMTPEPTSSSVEFNHLYLPVLSLILQQLTTFL